MSNSQFQEFYSQFEWFRMITVKREDNDDIILLPEDKDSAELIREIEAGKDYVNCWISFALSKKAESASFTIFFWSSES